MPQEIIESQSEQEHQDAVEDSERRTTAVDAALDKLVAYIEEQPEDPSPGKQPDPEFETTLPMTDNEPDQTPRPAEGPVCAGDN